MPINRKRDGRYVPWGRLGVLSNPTWARSPAAPDAARPREAQKGTWKGDHGPGKSLDENPHYVTRHTWTTAALFCFCLPVLCSDRCSCDFAQQTRGHNPLWHRALYLHCSLPTAHPPVSQLISQSVSQSLSIRALPTPRPRHTTIYSRHALALGIPQSRPQCC